MTNYVVIKSNVISTIKEVRLYEDTVQHVKQGHPEVPIELPSLQIAVTSALANPTHVEDSYGDSIVFVDAGTTNRSGDPLRIPVKSISETSGRVKTIYFASTTGDRKVIWRRGDA